MNFDPYCAGANRYDTMKYRRCGKSGIKLPELSLGLWHNFGGVDKLENCRAILRTAFDRGITHFDMANNYGPPPGSAEETFGTLFAQDFKPYRDELIISTKAGYTMWQGPYGDWGSKKYLVASLDQSLKRMGLDYVDIFYHHRPDPDTPLEETMDALSQIVRQGKALYVGISNYPAELTQKAVEILRKNGTPCLIHQAKYSMLNRWTEDGLLDVLDDSGVGCICFSPLAQGLLTGRYLSGNIPADSRAARNVFLKEKDITEEKLAVLRRLNNLAEQNDRTLARMAVKWILRDRRNTSVLIGASSVDQLNENLKALDDSDLDAATLAKIDEILKDWQ